DRGVPHPWLAAQSRAEHGAAGLAASRLGHASRAADGARAPGGADRRAADRAHAPAAVARALRADAPRRGHRAGGAGLSGHLLHRQSQGVGKVWQITACDAASSYGVAALLPTHTAADAAAFLRD